MKINLLICFSFMTMVASSQPTLTESVFLPVGTQITVSVHSGAISPGSAGANQTWNFSALSNTPVGQILFVSPSSTACGSQFPTTNYAMSIPNGTFHYFIRSSTDQQWVGKNWPAATCTGGVTYSDYLKNCQFPFSYLDTYSDTYAADDGSSGTTTAVYDAYGTLITPFGTFNNVGRIKYTDSTNTDYGWFYGSSLQYELMRTIDGNQSTLIFSNPVMNVDEIENNTNTIVYPNPFSSEAVLHINSNLSFINTELHFYDVVGKEVKRIPVTKNETILTNQGLSNGFYYYSLIENGKPISKGKIIIQ